MSPNSSTLESAILSHSSLEEPAYSWPSAMPELLSLHSRVSQLPMLPRLSVAISTHMSKHQVPQEHVQEGERLGITHLAHFKLICACITETAQKWGKGRAHRCHWWEQPSPGGKLCISLQIYQWCSRRESPTQDKAEQQQVLLPIPLQAVGIYTASTRVNPQSLMRTDPMLPSSLLAQALICILNSCLRRPNVLQHCCCAGCLLWLPFLAKVQPRCRCHHPAQMCRAPSSQLVSNRAIHVFLENIMKKSCQSWMHIISN